MHQAHDDLIREQFTRQATPFSTAQAIANDEALRLLVELAGAGPEDTLLDVGCGGGLVVCAFAPVVRHATGIDLTPAMLDHARALAAQKGLTNVTWQQGDCPATAVPGCILHYRDGAFYLPPLPRSPGSPQRNAPCLCAGWTGVGGGHGRFRRAREGRRV